MKTDSTTTRQNGEDENGVNDSSLASQKPPLSGPKVGFNVEWSEDHERLSALGGLVYFAQFLDSTGMFDELVAHCPLSYQSNNAPSKRDVLGTILLSALQGQTRYAHMATLAGSQLDAQSLGMSKIPSEDSIRGALKKLAATTESTQRWLEGCFDRLGAGCLEVPWVLDIDVTVKPLYGKQEGAVVGYNPAKPGRPSHAYHSFWVGHLRLCLGVQVRPGNETAGLHGLEPLMQWLDRTPRQKWPEFVRGDIGYGTQNWMVEAESKGLRYLFKLRQTKKVKELIALCELESEWQKGSGNWQYCESQLQLSGWNCRRRVVIYRRAHVRKTQPKQPAKALEGSCAQQAEFTELELVEDGALTYEYAIYVTDLERDASQVRDLYNPRGDNENCYDELKNHWGWGGFTLRDLARSELMANLIALIYNLWSVYIKLVDPLVAREAITSRPMYLMHPAKVSTHQSQRTLTIYCAHNEIQQIKERLEEAAQRLKHWAQSTTEQLKALSVWARVIIHILLNHHTIGAGDSRAPPALTAAV